MIPEEIKQKFLRYENMKLEAKAVETEMKELAAELVQYVPEGEKLSGTSGVFSAKVRNSYKYSDGTKRAEEELKATKKREEQDGTATVIPGDPYLEYRANKGEEE